MYLQSYMQLNSENLKQKINYKKLKQKIKSEIREKINCTNINTKLNKKIAQILKYNFMDLIKPEKHKIKIKNVIFRFIKIKTCTYPIHKIILKHYQIIFKTSEIK